MAKVTMIAIDPDKLRSWLKKNDLAQKEVCEALGKSASFLSTVMIRGFITAPVLNLLCRQYGVKPSDFTPDPKPDKEVHKSVFKSDVDCAVKVTVRGDRLRMVMSVNGREDIDVVSKIKSNSYLDFMQSFSYAAHMAYKFAEQREINDFR